MEFSQVVGLLAPFVLVLVTQGLKKVISSKFAPLAVLLIGGVTALLGVGPSPGEDYVDTTLNAGWISGVATLLYSLYQKNIKKAPAASALKSLIVLVTAASLLTGCAGLKSAIVGKPWDERTPVEKSLALMQFYNSQYRDTTRMATDATSSVEQKNTAMKKKAILKELWPLIDAYDDVAAGGGFPTKLAEDEILKLVNQLGGKL